MLRKTLQGKLFVLEGQRLHETNTFGPFQVLANNLSDMRCIPSKFVTNINTDDTHIEKRSKRTAVVR